MIGSMHPTTPLRSGAIVRQGYGSLSLCWG